MQKFVEWKALGVGRPVDVDAIEAKLQRLEYGAHEAVVARDRHVIG